MVALVRPESWNFPLFLHVLGGALLVGAIGATVVIAIRAPALRRLLVRTIGFLVLPAWLLMRIAESGSTLERTFRAARRGSESVTASGTAGSFSS